MWRTTNLSYDWSDRPIIGRASKPAYVYLPVPPAEALSEGIFFYVREAVKMIHL